VDLVLCSMQLEKTKGMKVKATAQRHALMPSHWEPQSAPDRFHRSPPAGRTAVDCDATNFPLVLCYINPMSGFCIHCERFLLFTYKIIKLLAYSRI